MNWTYEDVAEFLSQHFFIELEYNPGGSHRYFRGFVDGKEKLVQVHFHSSNAILPRTLQHDIAHKSGIPVEYWKDWANAGNNKQRKKIQYSGARKTQ